jgi:hypothetical protein
MTIIYCKVEDCIHNQNKNKKCNCGNISIDEIDYEGLYCNGYTWKKSMTKKELDKIGKQ